MLSTDSLDLILWETCKNIHQEVDRPTKKMVREVTFIYITDGKKFFRGKHF